MLNGTTGGRDLEGEWLSSALILIAKASFCSLEILEMKKEKKHPLSVMAGINLFEAQVCFSDGCGSCGYSVDVARPLGSLEAPLILCAVKSDCLLAKCSYSVSKYDLCKDQLSANLGLKHLYIFVLCTELTCYGYAHIIRIGNPGCCEEATEVW